MTRRNLLQSALLAGLAKAGKPTRLQLTTGGHDHEISFYDIFANHPEYQINVVPHPNAFRPKLLKDTDVLVLYDYADADPAQQATLRTFLESGKGMVVLHHAICDNQQWPWWYEEVVGGLYAIHALPGKPASKYKHDQEFDVRPVGSHPVIDGVGPFHINDEAYGGVWVSPKVQVLLETDHPLNGKPLAWIGPYRKSRVVYIQLGHGSPAHQHPMYRKLVHQAIAWCSLTEEPNRG